MSMDTQGLICALGEALRHLGSVGHVARAAAAQAVATFSDAAGWVQYTWEMLPEGRQQEPGRGYPSGWPSFDELVYALMEGESEIYDALPAEGSRPVSRPKPLTVIEALLAWQHTAETLYSILGQAQDAGLMEEASLLSQVVPGHDLSAFCDALSGWIAEQQR